jgi:hypothetical protein
MAGRNRAVKSDRSQVGWHDVNAQCRVPLVQEAAQAFEPVRPACHQYQVDAQSSQLHREFRPDTAARASHQRRAVVPPHGRPATPSPAQGRMRLAHDELPSGST